MKLKIQRYHKVEKGSLKGFVQVLFEDIGLTVNGVKVITSKNGKQFYAFPSEKYTDPKTNEEKYREHCAFYIKGLPQQFQDDMNEAFKVHFAGESVQPAASYYSQPTPQPQAQTPNSFSDDLPF